MHSDKKLKIRRALLSVSDKTDLVELGQALHGAGAELVATGRTATLLREAGLPVIPIENVSGSPEAFQGRMKTLSFPVCGGILYRRGDESDEKDLVRLSVPPIDCVVVNFYPFERAAARNDITQSQLIEEVDIGGPTLVRAAAKNAPDVVVLVDPTQYIGVIRELSQSGGVAHETAHACAARAWQRVAEYDHAIARVLGEGRQIALRYGENPHQKAVLECGLDSPIAWPLTEEQRLTPSELSYNNILDLSAAYSLASDLVRLKPDFSSVVIVKHNNPCGVASVPRAWPQAQKIAALRAWEGDPTSAFGGVLIFTDALEEETSDWIAERFVEGIAAPGLTANQVQPILAKRKKLKAVAIRRWDEAPVETTVFIPGGILRQEADQGCHEELRSVTQTPWPKELESVARFGIAVSRSLKSNAIAIVRCVPNGPEGRELGFQLVGAGQGQPNRVDALKVLAIPRAQAVLRETGGTLRDCVLVSDAFFPFRDSVDAAHAAGIRWIVQPGGSLKDEESIAACDEHGMAMAFTGIRHFKH